MYKQLEVSYIINNKLEWDIVTVVDKVDSVNYNFLS